MFSWFKKKRQKQETAVPESVKEFIRSKSLAVAIAEAIADFAEEVQNGKISTPAYLQQKSSVVDIWKDTRLEALWLLWDHGASDVMILADPPTQKQVLDVFFEEKPQFEFPHQPSNDPVQDTLQALFKVYLYLNEAGSAVMNLETDRNTLKIKGKTILDEFERNAEQLRIRWNHFDDAIHASGDLPPMPNTILEVLYRDVTEKSKTIALTAKFGPNYKAYIMDLEHSTRRVLEKKGAPEDIINEQIRYIQKTTQILLSAHDPDLITWD
jgi:hypothetical protein